MLLAMSKDCSALSLACLASFRDSPNFLWVSFVISFASVIFCLISSAFSNEALASIWFCFISSSKPKWKLSYLRETVLFPFNKACFAQLNTFQSDLCYLLIYKSKSSGNRPGGLFAAKLTLQGSKSMQQRFIYSVSTSDRFVCILVDSIGSS